MMTMMESTTTIDLTDTDAPTQETSIDEIHIETTEERLIHFQFSYEIIMYFQTFANNFIIFLINNETIFRIQRTTRTK